MSAFNAFEKGDFFQLNGLKSENASKSCMTWKTFSTGRKENESKESEKGTEKKEKQIKWVVSEEPDFGKKSIIIGFLG